MSKRQLSIIYFVDSSKTRTIKLPLGRVTVVLLILSAGIVWSAASAYLLDKAYTEQVDLTQKLRTSLATVFEYEARYDAVYDAAYPSARGIQPAVQAVAKKEAPPPVASALANIPSEEPSATEAEADAAGAAGEGAHAAAAKAQAAKTPEASLEPMPVSDTAATGGKGAPVAVGNPVIEAGKEALQVRFDLTNRNGGRAEGHIWAVAEFKTDAGDVSYIADPPDVGVKSDGDVKHPAQSSNFGIRRFKKMSFSFPVNKELNGTFTGIKIGVTDKSGANRTTYNVPVEIRIGRNDVAPPDETPITNR